MSDEKETREQKDSEELLSPQSPTDTSNWDDRVTTSPDGEKNVRSTDGDEESDE